jgi:hypothetical protein
MSVVLWIRVWVMLALLVDVTMGVANMRSRDPYFSAGMDSPGSGVRFRDELASFKVAIFADLHYGENAWDAWGPRQDVSSTAVQSFLLDHELPGE